MGSDPASDDVATRRSGALRRGDTTDPRRSRARALRILYQADLRKEPADATLGRLAQDPAAQAMLDEDDELRAPTTVGIDGFTRALVLGVVDDRERIDALIRRYARRWQIHRMPVVDRTVLRLATYELLHEDTPPAVVIDEAVTLAKSLSTDDSGRYVNGVLESIRKDVDAQRRASDDG